MSIINIEQLLEPIDSDQPCGEDLEYDPAYIEMEQLAQGKPEQQFGDTIIPAEEPDWREVKKRAVALLSRGKDLRVATQLLRALLHTDGLDGFRDGLTLLKGLVEHYWDGVHPVLDPDDDNDPTMRINAITTLCDAETMLKEVREAPLAASRALGTVSLRDVDIAAGRLSTPAKADEPPMDMTAVDAIFKDCDLEALQARAAIVRQCIEDAIGLEQLLTECLGAANSPDLSALPTLLRAADRELTERLSLRGVGAEPALAEVAEEGTPAAALPGGGGTQTISGEISSREDVVRMLDKICAFYQRNEPSSPVPLLLMRAKRLVFMDFMDIIRDLAPSGVAEVEVLRGAEEGQDGGGSSEDY